MFRSLTTSLLNITALFGLLLVAASLLLGMHQPANSAPVWWATLFDPQTQNLYRLQPETGLRHPLAQLDNRFWAYRWSPDGNWLLMSRQGEVRRVAWQGGSLEVIAAGVLGNALPGVPVLDEQSLLFWENGDGSLWRIAADGAQATRFYPLPQARQLSIREGVVTADGRQAYILTRGERSSTFWRVSIPDQTVEPLRQVNTIFAQQMILSPDSQWLAFQADRVDAARTVWLVETRTGELVRAFDLDRTHGIEAFWWTPDNALLGMIFRANTAGPRTFFKSHPDQTAQVLVEMGNVFYLAHSPDQHFLANVENLSPGAPTLYLINVVSGQRQNFLLPGRVCRRPLWSEDAQWVYIGAQSEEDVVCTHYRAALDGSWQALPHLDGLFIAASGHPGWLLATANDWLVAVNKPQRVRVAGRPVAWVARPPQAPLHPARLSGLGLGVLGLAILTRGFSLAAGR